MSYSVCLLCGEMVPNFEKYCEPCLKRNPHLKQNVNYWQTPRAETSDAPTPEICGAPMGSGVAYFHCNAPKGHAGDHSCAFSSMTADYTDWKAEAKRLRAAHDRMHEYLREIGDSVCEMCEALGREAKP